MFRLRNLRRVRIKTKVRTRVKRRVRNQFVQRRGIHIYGGDLFNRTSRSSLIFNSNESPGGLEGVDQDVQDKTTGGICAGITSAWAVGFCNRRNDFYTPDLFPSAFHNVIRFQGAYLQFRVANATSLYHLNKVMPLGVTMGSDKFSYYTGLESVIPVFPAPWAMFMGSWVHAIGVGKMGSLYYIMDPNVGLLIYEARQDFLKDLFEFHETRYKYDNDDPTDKLLLTKTFTPKVV